MKARIEDSPVEKIRKNDLPRGDGNWPGYDHVYDNLKRACFYLSDYAYLSEDHLYTMAVLGCGHEETMKYHLAIAKQYRWC